MHGIESILTCLLNFEKYTLIFMVKIDIVSRTWGLYYYSHRKKFLIFWILVRFLIFWCSLNFLWNFLLQFKCLASWTLHLNTSIRVKISLVKYAAIVKTRCYFRVLNDNSIDILHCIRYKSVIFLIYDLS